MWTKTARSRCSCTALPTNAHNPRATWLGTWPYRVKPFGLSTPSPMNSTKPTLRLQHLTLPAQRLAALQPVLDRVGNKLGVNLLWDSEDGELLVVERGAMALGESLLGELSAGRPVLWLDEGLDDDFLAGIVRQAFAEALEGLLQSPSSLPQVSAGPVGMVGSDWSPLSAIPKQQSSAADELACISRLHQLARDGARGTPLALGYPDHGAFVIDPCSALAFVDVGALAHLRASRRLPQVLDSTPVLLAPKRRPLDVLLWELGLAAAHCAPPEAPADWWQHPLEGLSALQDLRRYTLDTHHLAMARLLRLWPHSPAQLRQHSGAAPASVQGFVQAVLLLRLAFWQ